MRCAQVRDCLAELAGGELGPAAAARIEAHLGGCPSCGARRAELAEAVGLLRQVGQAQRAPASFGSALHLRLAREPAPRRPLLTRLAMGPALRGRLVIGAGAAAALAIALALAPGRSDLPPPSSPGALASASPAAEAPAPFQVPSRRIAVVHIDFVTDAVVDDVEFEVTLPAGLAFLQDGEQLPDRTLRWSGSLGAGSNPVPLAVTGSRPGRYKITARAWSEGVAVAHELLLEVVPS